MPKQVGRYVMHDELAAGGMATVHLGLVRGEGGFRRVVAIKRLHPHLSKETEFVDMFRDEAHIASRLRHPNIVDVLDVVADENELLLVMEYVHGEALSRINQAVVARGERIPVDIASALVIGLLSGLQAAHDATSATGEPLGIVHRDVSPQNVLVGVDGQARLADFGIAKAAGRLHQSREGEIKGKSSYIAPEQIRGEGVDRRADIYAAAVVFWELLTGRRLFKGENAMERMLAVLEEARPAPSTIAPEAAPLDAIVLSGIDRDPKARPQTARAMVEAIEQAMRPASAARVAAWLEPIVGAQLRTRADRVAEMEALDSERGIEIGIASTNADAETETALREPPASTLTPAAAAPKRSRFIATAILASIAVAGGIFVTAALRKGPSPTPDTPASSPPAVASPAPLPSASAAPAPSAPPSSPATPSASASARTNKRPPAVHPAKPAPKCDPPYVVDANGYRVPKRECL